MSRITVENVTRRYGGTTAVDAVSLDVADGDFLVLLGPSGCGKSTLLRTIAGLVAPSEGRVLVDDRDVTDVPARGRDLAMVFQSYALYPHLTVARNIGFPLRARRLRRAEVRRRVGEVADALELSALLDRRPRELSGGQRQRVALGRALVRDPGAFLMDEPLSNLDAQLRTATRTEITELHRRLRRTFVYVTHDQVEAMTMATSVAVLNRGRLEQIGPPTEVYDRPASAFVAGFLGSPPMNLLAAEVIHRDGQLHAVAAGVNVPLGIAVPRRSPDDAAGEPARSVLLGIRPEHLRVTSSAAAMTAATDATAAEAAASASGSDGPVTALRGVVRTVENLGSEEIAYCVVGDGEVSVRARRPAGFAVGDAVALAVDPGQTHLFDRESGRRLVWRPDPHPAVPSARVPVAT
ncbi:sn-glycerol 3-phosphate ABC transporter ATP binding subunit [Frankia sp. AiPs1]|uniref:ABC transporter ATP-binding protein n=1 Tax=Frankia sp. AiPa1 TaxID=573492 RepID=UPI00202AEA4D|nr:ATP-binding cassette domain-containing protein [Frankia sp. AiPa1]MCL9758697.1 ABC transporter ATP-binding protein [Frankia sp. AiPa1]